MGQGFVGPARLNLQELGISGESVHDRTGPGVRSLEEGRGPYLAGLNLQISASCASESFDDGATTKRWPRS
jgi:hypothetical protein